MAGAAMRQRNRPGWRWAAFGAAAAALLVLPLMAPGNEGSSPEDKPVSKTARVKAFFGKLPGVSQVRKLVKSKSPKADAEAVAKSAAVPPVQPPIPLPPPDLPELESKTARVVAPSVDPDLLDESEAKPLVEVADSEALDAVEMAESDDDDLDAMESDDDLVPERIPPRVAAQPNPTDDLLLEEESMVESNTREESLDLVPETRAIPATAESTVTDAAPVAEDLECRALGGYCPVALSENRFLKAQDEYRIVHKGCAYYLSSIEAVHAFQADPDRYTPAWHGIDPVERERTGRSVSGRYRAELDGKMYFFRTEANRTEFLADPEPFEEKPAQ
jgi:YHS domain-containing protein